MTQQPTTPQPTAALPGYPAANAQSSHDPQYPQPQYPQPQPMAPQYSQAYPPQPSQFTPASLPPQQGPFAQTPFPQASSPQGPFPQASFPQPTAQQAVWPSGTAATPPASIPPAPTQSEPQHSNVQMLLLVLGVALVTIAVLAFASFAYGLLGDIGRAVSIGVVGAIALAVGMALTNRLRVTAEGLTWAGLAALSIDAPLVSGIPPVARTIPNGVCTGVLILLVTALAFALRAIASHLPSNQTATVTDSQPNTQTIPSNAASSTPPNLSGFSAEQSVTQPAIRPAPLQPAPLQPIPLSPIPLRATTLYAMCAIPLAFMSIASSLPTDNHNVEWVLTVEIGSAAALLFAIFVRVPHTSRYADFEWMTSLTAATVGLTAVTFFGYALIMDADPLWLVIIICLIPPALWAAMLVMLHLKPTARTGSTLPPANRVMPTIGFIWSLSAGSESLLRRVLNGPLGNDQAAQTVADLLMIALTGFTITAATLMFRRTKRFTISKQERVSASVIGSLMMLIVIDSDFTHGSPLPMVVSIVGLVVMLAVTAISWIVAAHPTASPVTQSAPQSIQQPQQAMPQPAQPRWPQPALPHGTASKPLPAEHITVTVFTAITSLSLMYLAVDNPQPYAPVDLFAVVSGATALVIGVRWMQVRPTLRSWPALWPALTLLMVPSLLISWFEPLSLPRVLALFAISICALLLGALRGLQAPLVYGTVILVIHVLTVIWPWLAEFSRHYWWVWLLVGGVLLIAAAARYEASMRSMRSIASRISDLR
ncbi:MULTISPECIES: SCO7613 C-terminal domain-containing membrane protein [unclassified Bifidobacterium]|uniref:SCO7613 C-terminal domain-containing membrane protein n=1 Tax=unclassified Bifidobacterium TaxID=2608897 RepID=UPI00112C94B2|nr:MULTISPECIES: hypothetical protein [unclassified Bifidobacterium]